MGSLYLDGMLKAVRRMTVHSHSSLINWEPPRPSHQISGGVPIETITNGTGGRHVGLPAMIGSGADAPVPHDQERRRIQAYPKSEKTSVFSFNIYYQSSSAALLQYAGWIPRGRAQQHSTCLTADAEAQGAEEISQLDRRGQKILLDPRSWRKKNKLSMIRVNLYFQSVGCQSRKSLTWKACQTRTDEMT